MEQLVTSEFKLGIIAGGQLGKMLTLAASNWDIITYVLDPSKACPASNTCNEFVQGDFTCFDTVYEFGKNLDMITLEIERVNTEALSKLKSEGKKVYPDPDILRIIQDKGLQKEFYYRKGLLSSSFQLFKTKEAIIAAVDSGRLTFPFVQKARRDGYDGKGVHIVNEAKDLKHLLTADSVVENKVSITKEIAVIVCRSTTGEIKTFPAVEMEFNAKANLVEFLTCPAKLTVSQESEAKNLAISVIKNLDYEGILAVEMFLDKYDNVIINEIAPRPHNSGHHTIESAFTSQYEQHLRAIFGFPLGSTEIKLPAIMINILGEPGYEGLVKYDGLTSCMAIEGIKFHIYGKKTTRPFRKMGHATVLDHNIEKAKEKAKFIQQNLKVIT